jgi:hypothetical protein|tara:strand:- start:88 stop:270 length:183 start_codon:yes stop_codon:yes gene_type:complete
MVMAEMSALPAVQQPRDVSETLPCNPATERQLRVQVAQQSVRARVRLATELRLPLQPVQA